MFKSCRPDHYTITDCGFLPAIFLFLYTVLAIMISSRVRICACNGLADRKRGAPARICACNGLTDRKRGAPARICACNGLADRKRGAPARICACNGLADRKRGAPARICACNGLTDRKRMAVLSNRLPECAATRSQPSLALSMALLSARFASLWRFPAAHAELVLLLDSPLESFAALPALQTFAATRLDEGLSRPCSRTTCERLPALTTTQNSPVPDSRSLACFGRLVRQCCPLQAA